MEQAIRPLLLSLLLIASGGSFAQMDMESFTPGAVYRVTMVRTDANSQAEYLEQLNKVYIPTLEAAKKQGMITDYTLLTGDFANENDFNVMMLVEFPNLAALDETPASKAKWDAIRNDLRAKAGGKSAVDAVIGSYVGMRTMVGTKVMRQRVPKS